MFNRICRFCFSVLLLGIVGIVYACFWLLRQEYATKVMKKLIDNITSTI